MASSLTSGQARFASVFAAETGLDPHVVGAWLLAEQNGSAAQFYQRKNYNNWLNIARTDSGDKGGAHASVWSNPDSAAKASAEWIRGQGPIAHSYGKPASGITAILGSHGQGAARQVQAIARSGWASSGYNGGSTLMSLLGATGNIHAEGGKARTAAERTPTSETVKQTPTVDRGALEQAQREGRAVASLFSGDKPGDVALRGALEKAATEPQYKPKTVVQTPNGTFHAPVRESSTGSAVEFAKSKIGKYAETRGNNLGPELDMLEKEYGMTGQPWCAIFATTVVHHVNPHVGRSASVAQINEWAAQGSHGYHRAGQAQPGDLITFGSHHVGVVKDVNGGFIHTIEGNANGSGGVIEHMHPIGEGQIVRPK